MANPKGIQNHKEVFSLLILLIVLGLVNAEVRFRVVRLTKYNSIQCYIVGNILNTRSLNTTNLAASG